jgi:hypothetical protein
MHRLSSEGVGVAIAPARGELCELFVIHMLQTGLQFQRHDPDHPVQIAHCVQVLDAWWRRDVGQDGANRIVEQQLLRSPQIIRSRFVCASYSSGSNRQFTAGRNFNPRTGDK